MSHEIRRGLSVFGDGAVGKTSMLVYYARGIFPEVYTPVVCDQYVVDVNLNDETARAPRTVQFTLYDTPGQEDYPRLVPLAYEKADILLICFTIDLPESLENVTEKWFPEACWARQDVPILLIGCKTDLRSDPELAKPKYSWQRIMAPEEGHAVAKRIGAVAYLECSAKTGEGVSEVFQLAGKTALQKRKNHNAKGCIVV